MIGVAALLASTSAALLVLGIYSLLTGRGIAAEWARRRDADRLRSSPSAADAARRRRGVMVVLSAVGGGLALYLLLYFFSGSVTFSVAGFIGAFLLPGWVSEIQRTRLMIRVSEQLDQAMGLLVAQLRQGVALESAFAQVAQTIDEPLGVVFDQVVAATNVGLTFDQAVSGTRNHPYVVENPDYQVFVTQAIITQEHGGGNIMESFAALRDAIAARRKYRGAVQEADGQNLMESVMMFAIGLLVMVIYALMSPEGLTPLLKSPLGQVILLVSILGNILVLRKTHVGMLRRLRRV